MKWLYNTFEPKLKKKKDKTLKRLLLLAPTFKLDQLLPKEMSEEKMFEHKSEMKLSKCLFRNKIFAIQLLIY